MEGNGLQAHLCIFCIDTLAHPTVYLKVQFENVLLQNHQGCVLKCSFISHVQSIGSRIQIYKIYYPGDLYILWFGESPAKNIHESSTFFSPGCP